MTPARLKEIVDRHLKTGEFRKNRLCFKRRMIAPSWCSKIDTAPCLEGRWLVKSAKKDGKDVSRLENMKFVFSGNKLLIKSAWQESDDEGCFFTVNDAVTPHHLSFSELDDQVPVKGIYECSGNELKLCIRDESSDKGRPAAFGSAPESDLLMLELSRIE
ncbi:MAG: TIGR03067 domain-containing protein [Desulfonatronovibrionaceae bacterium]